MSTKIKLTFAVLALAASAALAGEATAATEHRRGWHAAQGSFIHRSVGLPYYGSAQSGRYSGPFRTDSAPLTGGGY